MPAGDAGGSPDDGGPKRSGVRRCSKPVSAPGGLIPASGAERRPGLGERRRQLELADVTTFGSFPPGSRSPWGEHEPQRSGGRNRWRPPPVTGEGEDASLLSETTFRPRDQRLHSTPQATWRRKRASATRWNATYESRRPDVSVLWGGAGTWSGLVGGGVSGGVFGSRNHNILWSRNELDRCVRSWSVRAFHLVVLGSCAWCPLGWRTRVGCCAGARVRCLGSEGLRTQ